MERCSVVTVLLGLVAAVILIIYSIYFAKIIQGNPREFELDLLNALHNWLQEGHTGLLWILLWASVVFEMIYFGLVLVTLSNPVTLALTVMVVVLEIWHLVVIYINLRNFFAGHISSAGIFNWKLERISALGFFTHSLIVLLTLLFLT